MNLLFLKNRRKICDPVGLRQNRFRASGPKYEKIGKYRFGSPEVLP